MLTDFVKLRMGFRATIHRLEHCATCDLTKNHFPVQFINKPQAIELKFCSSKCKETWIYAQYAQQKRSEEHGTQSRSANR
jgi:hypothetical protein